ncbi:6514_t:CDS:1 [Dentiscutata heterogama]|uniref:6514_t:CDS:1 n=1 Tax=Dentiscutata heterogama TaxID=1316150 RepID=A0ACA9LST5_9GLOM|nr:6514_t:CDS:1 [Dentiscutata heterogama]
MSDFSDIETNFRLDSAQLHLTYTKCDLDLEDILNYVKSQCESKKKIVMNYVVVREPHPDGILRIHAYFQLCSKISIRDPRFFDIEIYNYDKKYRANVEGVRTSKKVKEYIMKDEDYISNMKIDTLNKAIYMVNSGTTIREIAIKCPKTYVKSGRGLENLKARVDEKNFKFKKPFVEVHYGDKNCGKSSYTELYPDDIAYRFDEGYFDGYDGQEILILDEFNGSQLKLAVFLKIMSGQQRRFNIKGKKVINNVRHIIITSNKHYTEWYERNKYDMGQSEWRIECIWHYRHIENVQSFSQRKIERNPYTFTNKKKILAYLKKIDYPKKFPESLSHDEKVFVEGYIGIPYDPKFDEDSSDDNESSEDVVRNNASILQKNFDNTSGNNKRKRDDFNKFEHMKRKKIQ